uniref:Methyltransferase small n=1 Tax=Nitratidesulfovibrio vulgaris (strain DSM 19637 / Miyazaki F) TaxID=883 RepID=B8DM60_NITV9
MRRNAPDMTDMTGTTGMAGTTGTTGTAGSPGTLPGSPPDSPPDSLPDAVVQARALFPRGLVQPVGGFRFSVDALLLAAFAGEALSARGGLTADAAGIRHGHRAATGACPASGQGLSGEASRHASGGASGDASGGAPGEASGEASGAFADLGTGCGVVGLALLLAHPHLTGTGIDIDGELANTARQNGARLGLADRFRVLRADLAATGAGGGKDGRNTSGMPEGHEFSKAANLPNSAPDAAPLMATPVFDALPRAGSMDLVVANPPYRRHGSGRPSPNSQRTRALFESPETLPAFTRAAARLLRARGRSCWVYGPDRLPDLLLALRETGQEPARLRCVHARAHGPATLVLVEARRAGKPGLLVEPPLILHSGEGAATALTDEALAFCPLLACNAGGREK